MRRKNGKIIFIYLVVLAISLSFFLVLVLRGHSDILGTSFKRQNLSTASILFTSKREEQIIQADGSYPSYITKEALAGWNIYSNKAYGFEFKYPKGISINEKRSVNYGNYGFTDLEFKKWGQSIFPQLRVLYWDKEEIIPDEDGLDNVYDIIAYNNWHYFISNFQNFSSGECSSKIISLLPKSQTLKNPAECRIEKKKNFLKVETDEQIIFYSGRLELVWPIDQKNRDIMKKIANTMRFPIRAWIFLDY